MAQFVVNSATKLGREHLLSARNRQDAHIVFDGPINGKRVIIGIIADGCSDGDQSEAGAIFATQFLAREAIRLISWSIPLKNIPNVLYSQLKEFLYSLTTWYAFVNEQDRATFINDQLLFTVVGFILTEDEAITFITGDGVIVINGETHVFDQNDRAMYPAYHLVDRSLLSPEATKLPDSFDVIEVDVKTLTNLAIGCDAWLREKELLSQIWGLTKPGALQRRINVLSDKQHHFGDDVTIIAVESVQTPDPIGEVNNEGTH